MTEALDLLLALRRTEDGSTWGQQAAPWQLADAAAITAAPDAGPRRHFLVRPKRRVEDDGRRRGRAGVDDRRGAEAVPVLHCAVDQEQALDLLDAMSGFVARTPGLAGAVDLGARGLTVKASGATLTVESSDAASAFRRTALAGDHRRIRQLAGVVESSAAVERDCVGVAQGAGLASRGAVDGGFAGRAAVQGMGVGAVVLGLAGVVDAGSMSVLVQGGHRIDTSAADPGGVPALRAVRTDRDRRGAVPPSRTSWPVRAPATTRPALLADMWQLPGTSNSRSSVVSGPLRTSVNAAGPG